jgi:hypothetical protein
VTIQQPPDAAVPDQGVPDLPVPDLPVPDWPVPDWPVPDQPIPDSEPPDQALPDQAVTATPILWYKFDGNANNSGSLGATYNGNASSVTYVSGKVGQGVQFGSTSSSYITIPNSATPLSSWYTYTIGVWFYEASTLNWAYLWDFRTASGGCESYHGVNPSITTCCSGSSGSVGCRSFTPTVATWHHLILRYAGTSTSPGGGAPLQLYLDGTLVNTIPNASGNVIFSSSQLTNLVIGLDAALSEATNFILDELKVYNQVFTEAEQCTIVIGGTWGGSSCTLP